MKDPYQILGVQKDASLEQIKKSYFEKAKKHHPDLHPGDKSHEEIFKEVNNAYDILKDPQKRAAFDQTGSSNFQFSQTNQGFGNNHFWYSNSNFGNQEEINDILNNIFSQQGFHKRQVYQNQNINLNYQITLEDAFHGKETEISYSYKNKNQTLKLSIPQGIENGMRIRYAKMGDDSLAGVPPGDLFVNIGIIPHQTFNRVDRYTLLIQKDIDYLDAIIGKQLEINTIDGQPIRITIPPDVTHKRILKISGKGMKDQSGHRGDMLVEVNLVTPVLSQSQRDMIHQIKNEVV